MSGQSSKLAPLRARLSEIYAAIGNIPLAFQLLWEADRTNTLWLAIVTLIGATPDFLIFKQKDIANRLFF
jgi:hypothetical protein